MRQGIFFLATLLSAVTALALNNANGMGADPVSSFRATVRGAGTLQHGLSREAVREVTVQFRRNGEAEVRLAGDQTATLVGRWFTGRGGTVDLEILQGFGSSLSTGQGQMRLQGSHRFTRLELSGKNERGPFLLIFNAD
jgi:hypothetical protein